MVVCLGEGMAELVRAKGVPRSRIAIIEDGAWAPVSEPRESVVLQLRREAPFVAMYAGNIGSAFRWETLSEADALLEDAEIILVGEGSQVPSIEGKVRIEPFRPLDELASVMAAGDLQIVPLRKEMSGQIVPSKLFTVLSHGRPVLAAVAADSEVARVIQEWGCGVLVDPDRPDEIASEITRLSRSPDSVQAMASRAKEAGEHYERGRLLREFATLVESFASTSDRNER